MGWLRRHPREILTALLFLVLNGAVTYFSVLMQPLPKGTPEEFWDSMYRLKLGSRDYSGGVYRPRDGWCIYYYQGYHGQSIYAVPVSDADRLLPEVRRRALSDSPFLSAAERELLTSNANIDQLVDARIAAVGAEDSKSSVDRAKYRSQELDGFEIRWTRIKRYWLNILFEAVFLNAWLVLVVLPLLRPSIAAWSKSIFVGFAFPFLFLPYFLGYCSWTFTSAGPCGGALYPWMIIWFRGWSWGTTSLDGLLLRGSGFPLEPLSQMTGPMMSVSGMGGMAPTFAIVVGVLLGSGVGFLYRALPGWRAKISSLRQRLP
jgi:hypothetical protein